MKIRSLYMDEQKYTYAQSTQIEGQTGCIGHLRGDFGSGGNEFFTSWFDHRRDLKTDQFKNELDEVINALRSEEYASTLRPRRRCPMSACRRTRPGRSCTCARTRPNTSTASVCRSTAAGPCRNNPRSTMQLWLLFCPGRSKSAAWNLKTAWSWHRWASPSAT